MIRLSVLDLAPVCEGSTPAAAFDNMLDLARHAESWGYHRYWLAEHHNMPGIASAATAVLIAHVAAATRTIRVGAGGVMLPNHAPLQVAEQFGTLASLYPGRIDLGLGRAPGGMPLASVALHRDHRPTHGDDFPNQLAELLAFLHGGFEDDHPFAKLPVTPAVPGGPEVWVLGSSGFGAAYAAHLGLPFCSALFINPVDADEVSRRYLRDFRGTDLQPEPQLSIATSVIVADDHEEAERLARPLRLWRLRLMQAGDPGPIPSVEEAEAYQETPAEHELLARQSGRLISGSAAEVRTQLEELAELHGAEEVVAVTITPDHASRRRSYELLAKQFDLTSP